MTADSNALRKKLKKFGLTDHAITAAWPDWWSDEADSSMSARNELSFSLARKLGLDPISLLSGDEPRFTWRDEAKFKHFSGESDFETAALTSFGVAIARTLTFATPSDGISDNLDALTLRSELLKTNQYISLKELISLCWALGIPLIQLKVFPLSAKMMCAMAVNVDGRHAILIGRESSFPAQLAYYVAHELGHIFLGHIKQNLAVVELGDILKSPHEDEEEIAADEFALELLTGSPKPVVTTDAQKFLAKDLADRVIAASTELRIEPGTLALCLGHSTGKWEKAFASMKHIYNVNEPLWKILNQAAASQMDFASLNYDQATYISAVMGMNK